MRKFFKLLVPFAIISALSLIFLIMMLYYVNTYDNKIYPGITIRNISVGGMTKEDAKKTVNSILEKELENMKLKLYYNNRSFIISSKELNASYDIDKAVEAAYMLGKNGNVIQKSINIWKFKKYGYFIPLNFSMDTENVKNTLVEKIASEIDTKPVDAKISYLGNGNFEIIPEKEGVIVDREKLKALIDASVNPAGGFTEIEIPVSLMSPKLTATVLSGIKEKISGFTTSFNPADTNRSSNINLAARTINGIILMPGEIFSMNDALGPRSSSAGYTDAPIIINGVLKPGLAGGICQVTTTVYNAALLANLSIIERHQHTLKVAYVDASRDATISGSSLDLKFKNITSSPVYIEAFTETSKLTVNFYGTNDNPNRIVKIISQILYTIEPEIEYIYDSSIEQGKQVWIQNPAKGMKSRAYREIYENEILINKELLSVDIYQPVKGKLKIGTKPTDDKKN